MCKIFRRVLLGEVSLIILLHRGHGSDGSISFADVAIKFF